MVSGQSASLNNRHLLNDGCDLSEHAEEATEPAYSGPYIQMELSYEKCIG